MKLTPLTVFFALIYSANCVAQVGIGTETPNVHSVLDLKSPSNNQGLMVPNISNAQRSSSSMISSLRGVHFDWRTDEFPEKNFSSKGDIGFIAQEIKEILPEVVLQDKDGYFTVSYEKVITVLIEAIKQQQTQIIDLRINQMEIELMTSKLAALEGKLVSGTVPAMPSQPEERK